MQLLSYSAAKMLVKVIILALSALLCTSAKRTQVCYNQFQPPLEHLKLGCYNYSLTFRPSGFPKPSDPQVLAPKFVVQASANNFETILDATKQFGPDTALPIRPGAKLVILAPGFDSDHTHPFVTQTKRDLLETEDPDLVVVALSWPRGSGKTQGTEQWPESRLGKIRRAASNSRVVGALLARFVAFLKADERYAPAHVHCVGFSIGAHLCGFAGKRYQQLSRGRDSFDRITGLDPATPVFKHARSSADHLWHTDARLVDVVHTNTLLTGMRRQLGHLDFYLGDGATHRFGEGQPGCELGTFTALMHKMKRWVVSEEPSIELEDLEGRNEDGSVRSMAATSTTPVYDERESSTLRRWWDSIGTWMGDEKRHWYVHCSHQRAWEYFGKTIRGECRYSSELVDGRRVAMGYPLEFDPRAVNGDREFVRVHVADSAPYCQKE